MSHMIEQETSSSFGKKIRQTLVRNLGLGIESDNGSAWIFHMKQGDIMKIGWCATQFHVNRIYRDLFRFHIETETVRTQLGLLRGRKDVSALGRTFFRFMGIPYAKPPMGSLRFKDPEPLEPWEGVRDALKEGQCCAHFDLVTGSIKGSEDCLFLNVFTPQLPQEGTTSEPKAVLLWIHGGGFQLGSGSSVVYGPDFFLEEDVILVTINYRLGALGFLSVGTEDAPGNMGLKDMVMALKWVQNNISAFGGDPNRVCIFGESAGGAAVQYLILSPMARGLFQCAISQSGSVLAPWAFHTEAQEAAQRLASKFGCDSKDPKAIVELLRNIPARTLAKKQGAGLSSIQKRQMIPFPFLPCAETPGPNAFITKDPRTMLENGEFNPVPYITGINAMEGMISLRPILDKNPPINEIENDFERLVPWTLKMQPGSEKSKDVSAKLREFYFKGKCFDKTTYPCYVDLATDTNFLCPMLASTNFMLKKGDAPIYNYEFTHDGDFALFKKILGIDLPGPTHADEISYMFYVPVLKPNVHDNTNMKVVSNFIQLWCNFAKYQNPTPPNDSRLNLKWDSAGIGKNTYLDVGKELIMKTNVMPKRAAFWDEIYKSCEIPS